MGYGHPNFRRTMTSWMGEKTSDSRGHFQCGYSCSYRKWLIATASNLSRVISWMR
jgi:hypothetical protein